MQRVQLNLLIKIHFTIPHLEEETEKKRKKEKDFLSIWLIETTRRLNCKWRQIPATAPWSRNSFLLGEKVRWRSTG